MAHHLAGIAAAARGGVAGAALASAALASFDRDFHGRSQWLARVLPAGEGANVLARIPARGERRRTLVLVAHHDTAQTGLVWRRPELAGVGTADAVARLLGAPAAGRDGLLRARRGARLRARGARRPRRDPAGACRGGRRARARVAARARRGALTVVPGASDNATGVAAVLSLAGGFAREPLEGTEVVLVLPGCEESGMGGMRAWVESEGASARSGHHARARPRHAGGG